MEDNLKKTEQEVLVNEAANISEQVRKDYL